MSSIKGDAFDFSIKNQIEETANDSDKTFTVPAGKMWKVFGIHVYYTASADAGNRNLTLTLIDTAAKVNWSSRSSAAQAANSQIWHHWTPGAHYPATVNYCETLGLPNPCILPAGWSIRLYDADTIAVAADDMLCYLIYGEVDV